MDLSKTYEPQNIENRLYQRWLEAGIFHSEPNDQQEPYTVVMPPPNVTGVLHMGHMLNNTIQDILIRRARMQGKNACWVPGTDHASIATEAKVVNYLREQGINKKDLTREEFMKHAWEWKEKYGGIILEQLKKLGASCDWDRTRFTMDEEMSRQVTKVFVDLYRKGLIYRGPRMVNWDPKGKTAISDEEVIYKEEKSKLYYVRYRISGQEAWLTIATTRPETILGDTAICVHPEDERYKELIGARAIVPLVEREVPIIADEYVDPEFGTGCLKITPAHDPNDYVLGKKHGIPFIDILDDDGKLSDTAQFFVGQDRFEARQSMANKLDEEGLLAKVEDITNKVGYSERTDVVIEPKISIQWFMNMQSLAKPALDAVENNDILFFPSKFDNTYRHWMNNIKDWCISRQLWWGQRIPAWYVGDDEYFVAETAEEALELARGKTGNEDVQLEDLRQDEDVVDTWFSSWLWPMSVFNGITDSDNREVNYYYPTDTLVTGPDIIFFWVARMIMAGYEYRQEKPFDSVYFTGIVRDKQRRKLSKSLGNSPDPLELIKENGADAIRSGILFSSPAGNDVLYDEELLQQGRNFCNKMWNALRLVTSWREQGKVTDQEGPEDVACTWFRQRLLQVVKDTEQKYAEFRISEILKDLYSLIWDEFCSWYLEMVKPQGEEQISASTYEATLTFFEDLMKLLHPVMPFITEEIYQLLREREEFQFIATSRYPVVEEFDPKFLQEAQKVLQLITEVRSMRANGTFPTQQPVLYVKDGQSDIYNRFSTKIQKLAKLDEVTIGGNPPDKNFSFLIQTDEFYMPRPEGANLDEQREKLEEDLKYQQGFLKSVLKKLENKRFVDSAPPTVVEKERQKQADAEEKIRLLEEKIGQLRQ